MNPTLVAALLASLSPIPSSTVMETSTQEPVWRGDIDMTMIPGARMYFSDKPFGNTHDGATATLSSSGFVYGRIELENKTLLDAFKLAKDGGSLRYAIGVYKDNRRMAYWGNNSAFLAVTADQQGKTALNFDIAPSPNSYSSAISQTEDFSTGKGFPFYSRTIHQQNFPSNGAYTILVLLYHQSSNDWGNKDKSENWPVVAGAFTYNFSGGDVATLSANGQAAREKANTVHVELPEYFAKPVAISDPTVTVAKVTPLIKEYLGSEYQVLKVAIQPEASMWSTVKNEVGIRSYRYVTGYYRIVYQQHGKCMLGSIRVLQDYIGNEKWGNLYVKFWGDEGVLDCAKVK
jgi:hypothetical protein